MSKYTKHFNTKETPQSQAVPGKKQVKNQAGGFVFQVDNKTRLDRFLILGTEGGTFYQGEQQITVENANSVVDLIQSDGPYVVNRIVEVSQNGEAPKNDAAIFALALCTTFGDKVTKKLAYDSITKVCRIGTHLFDFVNAIQGLRGWSKGLQKGIGKFYLNRTEDSLAYQLIKYRQRNGVTHRDVLRLSHAKAKTSSQNELLAFAALKLQNAPENKILNAFLQVQELSNNKKDIKKAINLITDYNLPREALPTELLNSVDIWAALNEKMPLNATIRNLGKMTSMGLLDSAFSEHTKKVVERLSNKEILTKSRVHPIAILNALKTYEQGQGFRGSLRWDPVQKIIDSLDSSFYAAFGNVESTGKNTGLYLDCSGSMFGAQIAGTQLDAATAAAAMALVTANVEDNYEIKYFSSGSNGYGFSRGSTGIGNLKISPKDSLSSVMKTMRGQNWGGTDCSLPMTDAIAKKLPIDNFIIYTDNDTWAGNIHPFQALKKYRQASGREGRLCVVGTSASGFSIADPSDAGMLDVVGFSTATPKIISNFCKGKL